VIKIEYKKYERKVIPFERRFFRSPNQTISLVARVKGSISEGELRTAIQKVRHQHPLVGVRIYLDKDNEPIFTTEKVPENPLRVVQRTSENSWQDELLKEYKILFNMEKGPLTRFVLLQSSEISEILIVCHHVICDGTSLAILARDVLLYLGDPNRKVQEMPEPPLATSDNFPVDGSFGKLINFILKKVNTAWQKKKVIFNDVDIENLFNAFWENHDFRILTIELSEEETTELVEKSRKNGVTLNSALNTAFLAARNSIRGPFKGGKRNIILPVNTRKRYKNPVGEHFGLYVAGFQIKLSYNPKKSFWENARIFNQKVRKTLDINKIFKLNALTELIDQSIVDARQFVFFGNLVSPTASSYDKIHAFVIDEKNIANKMAKKQIPKLPGLAITNLGNLEYPRKYGSLELDRFIFVTSGTPYIELVIPAVTVAGKLTFTINYLEEITDTPNMKRIKYKTLEYLRLNN
jgi:NRPS condensation-like uncharacterized protein